MSYIKHNYKKGDELLASQLNEMDNQIALNEENINSIESTVNELDSSVDILEPTAASSDVGKFLKVKTVANGKTSQYEFATPQVATDAQVSTAVNTWLGNNVTQETGYVLDRSLLASNAAAPADLVGLNRISDAAITIGSYDCSIVFESGAYGTNGEKISNVKQLRSTNEFYFCAELYELTVPTGYRIFLYEVDPVTHAQIKSTTYQSITKRVIQISNNVNIRIGGRKNDNTAISDDELAAFNSSFRLTVITTPLKIKTIGTVSDLNLIDDNTIIILNDPSTDFINGPTNFTDWKTGKTYIVLCYTTRDAKYQVIRPLMERYDDAIYSRFYNITNGLWTSWSTSTLDAPVIHIGTGQKYTTIRDGIAAAYATTNATVYVHEGTYDLITEFADKIASHESDEVVGNPLGHGMKIYFYEGAKVTALFNRQNYDATTLAWIDKYFSPFYAFVGDYSIENANIEAANCRYCLHDDRGATGIVRHSYKNCKMIFTKDSGSTYVSCIGGGLAEHTYVDIDGGYFQVINNEEPANQAPISYHNGALNTAQSQVYIKNVYLADRGHFAILYHGASTLQTNVYISGCSVGAATIKDAAQNTDSTDNMTVIEWNTTIRT